MCWGAGKWNSCCNCPRNHIRNFLKLDASQTAVMWLIVYPGEHRYRGILDFSLFFFFYHQLNKSACRPSNGTTLMCKWHPWQKCVQALDYGGILYSLMPSLRVCQLSVSQNAFLVMYPPHFAVCVWWTWGWGLANFDGSLSRMQLGKSCAKHVSEPMFAFISARNQEFALNTAWPFRWKRDVYRESGPVPHVWQNMIIPTAWELFPWGSLLQPDM